MSINLERLTTYQVNIGASLHKSNSTGQIDDSKIDSGTDEGEYHLVTRQLPRSTTKLSRETLEKGNNARARLLGTAGSSSRPKDDSNNNESGGSGGGKMPLLLEIDTQDQSSTCAYEGEYEHISHSDENDEVDCLLIYDDESKSFVIERVGSNVLIKSSTANGAGATASSSMSTGQLALPANKYVPPKDGAKKQDAHDTQASLDDSIDAELARELEGALDDLSDPGDGKSANPSRRGSAHNQHHKREGSEDDQLNMELAENIDEALQDALSDDDEFEEVDDTHFMGNGSGSANVADIEVLSDHHSDIGDDEEEDDMIFEEVDPSADMDGGSNSNNNNNNNPAESASLSFLESDSDEFEEIDNGQGSDSLFGESARSSPSGANMQQQQRRRHSQRQHSPHGIPADPDNEDSSEFEDLENDLARSLENI
ncbi:hypothetical protein GGI12_003578 [Dipsacomyces acuminosporus]|nr:hypothetical protein GGI12_003578 [Dipsacomyces acuminosporus]